MTMRERAAHPPQQQQPKHLQLEEGAGEFAWRQRREDEAEHVQIVQQLKQRRSVVKQRHLAHVLDHDEPNLVYRALRGASDDEPRAVREDARAVVLQSALAPRARREHAGQTTTEDARLQARKQPDRVRSAHYAIALMHCAGMECLHKLEFRKVPIDVEERGHT